MIRKMPFLLFPICLLFILCSIPVSAQVSHTIHGKVVDAATGLPIAGATVQEKGSASGTATDESGLYKLNVSANSKPVIVFSFVGYQNHEVKVGTSGVANISLEAGTSALNEIVVIAYSSEKKKDITGAVSVVNMDNLSRQPTGLVTEQLQGQASGVTVITSGQPGADPQIRIRGINTFGNNSPLFVVDGTPTQNIADLNVNNIASMQVLKDAGAASIYGSRASNGVIIITTKRGSGKVVVHYDGYYGTQLPKSGNVWNLLNPQEEANLTWIAQKNSGSATPSSPLYGNGATPILPDYITPAGAMAGSPLVDPSLYNVNPNYTDISSYNNFYRITPANKTGTDWYHEVFKQAPMQRQNISVSGGGDKGSYLFSMGYLDQKGSLINTYLKRYTVRSNAQYIVSKHIRIGENLETSISHNPTINDIPTENNFQGTSAIFFTMQISPIIPVHDIKGNYGGVYGTGLNGPNPVAIQRRTANNADVANRLLGNVYADVQFLNDFTFHTSLGGDNYSGARHSFNYPTYENAGNSTVNSFTQSSYSGFNWTWTNTLTYAKQIGQNHHLSAMLGTEAYQSKTESLTGTTQGYLSFDPNYTTLSSGSGVKTNGSGRTMESLSSAFGRIDYSFKDKYLFSGTLRRDGSSKFINYQYGWFPAVSAGWRISQENFMKNYAWITDMKIRGSWGMMGNQLNVNADNGYSTYLLNINSAYYDIAGTNNTNQSGLQVGQNGNPNARWEKDYSTNIGLDATFWNGRFNLTADYYQKDIQGLLYNPAQPGTAGLGNAPFINVAGVKNNGIDMSLTYHQNLSKKLKLDAGLILTTYHNEITQVTDQANYFWTNDQRHYGSNFIRNEVGHAIGSFYGYKITGFWNSAADIATADQAAQKETGNTTAIYQPDEAVGRFRYADLNGDQHITDSDRTFLGNPNPKFSYGLNLRLTYGQFDMSMFFYGVHGNDLWNVTKYWTDFSGYAEAKSKTALYNSWSPTHQNAKVSLPELGQYQSTNGAPNSYYIENGSYLKLKNIEIGYTFPVSLLKNIGIDRFRVYFQATNVFTVTKYSGIDPEVSGSVTDFGVDEGIYPNMRQFLGGISLSF